MPHDTTFDSSRPERLSLTVRPATERMVLLLVTSLSAVRLRRASDQAATWKSWLTKRISLRTPHLHVRQCPRRIIRMISNPLIVAVAVCMV